MRLFGSLRSRRRGRTASVIPVNSRRKNHSSKKLSSSKNHSSKKLSSSKNNDFIDAPSNIHDPRLLGKGSSKMGWLQYPNAERGSRPRDDTVIVNSLEEHRTYFGETERDIQQYYKYLENEYNFTVYLKTIFPDLIPKVGPVKGIHPIGPFRYSKERCYTLPRNTELFHHMIRITDDLNYNGWAYLDMKHENIGFRDKRVLLLDTDPYCFFRVPSKDLKFYKICSHMIILLICLNHIPEVPHSVLCSFIHARGYTSDLFKQIYQQAKEYEHEIYNKEKNFKADNPYLVDMRLIKTPLDFLVAYGIKKDKHSSKPKSKDNVETVLEVLLKLIETPITSNEKNKIMNVPCHLDPEDSFPYFIEKGKHVFKHELVAVGDV